MTAPQPTPEELPALYGESYYGAGHQRFLRPLELVRRAFSAWRARDIARRRSAGTLLDVGCGRGSLLAALRRRGWNALGTELSEEAAAHARDRLGLRVATGDLTRIELAPASVDVVVMWQTFEHMPDPRGVLDRVRTLLRPGGWLVVSVPNRASWQARMAGPHWFHLDVPRHLHHFDEATLRRLVTEAGFRVLRVSQYNWEQNPFGWVQSLLNMASGASNGLYDALRGARGFGNRATALASMLVLPVLVPAAFALAGAESMAGRGGTVTLWATT